MILGFWNHRFPSAILVSLGSLSRSVAAGLFFSCAGSFVVVGCDLQQQMWRWRRRNYTAALFRLYWVEKRSNVTEQQ